MIHRICRYTAAAIAAVLLMVASAYAQTIVQFDLPQQPLADALREFGRQANINVLFDPPIVAAHQAPALQGQISSKEALTRLLQGTGLEYEFISERTVAIRLGKLAQAKPTAAVIGESSIHLASAGSTAENPSFWERFRLAQAAGQADESSSVGPPPTQPRPTRGDNLEEVVVTAQKRIEKLQDVPVPVTALSANTLVESNELRVQDYYTSVPGLSIASADSGSSQILSIRGINTGWGTHATVGVTVDDVPYGASTGELVPDIDPFDLARVEVLRGPQGTLYGASSMGGVLKFVTVDPSTDGLSGRLQAGVSSVHNGADLGYGTRGAVNIPLSDAVAIRLSGFTRKDPGYVDNPVLHVDGVNADDAYGGRAALLWKPSQDLSVKLGAVFQRTRGDGSSDIDVEPGLMGLQQNYPFGVGSFQKTYQVYSATVNARVGNAELIAVSGYNIDTYSQSSDLSGFLGSATENLFHVGAAPGIDLSRTNKLTQEVRLSVPLGRKLEWLMGGFYTHERSPDGEIITAEQQNTGQIVGQWLSALSTSTYTEYAAFTDLTFHFTDTFDLQVGGRESRITQDSGAETEAGPYVTDLLQLPSPTIVPAVSVNSSALTYLATPRLKISPDLMVYARLASGYRPGGANVALGVPRQYDPDKTKNYEIGVKGDVLDHLLVFDTSLYYIDWKDIQLTLLNQQNFQNYVANASAAKSEGAEISLQARPGKGLTVTAWVAWDDAVLTEGFPPTSQAVGARGDRLPYTARFSGSVSADWEFPIWQGVSGFLGATESYVGARVGQFITSEQRQQYPAYAKTDLRAGVRYGLWACNLFVTNVGDKRGLLGGGIGNYPDFAFNYIQPRTAGMFVSREF